MTELSLAEPAPRGILSEVFHRQRTFNGHPLLPDWF
jgi:hypothetical protein